MGHQPPRKSISPWLVLLRALLPASLPPVAPPASHGLSGESWQSTGGGTMQKSSINNGEVPTQVIQVLTCFFVEFICTHVFSVFENVWDMTWRIVLPSKETSPCKTMQTQTSASKFSSSPTHSTKATWCTCCELLGTRSPLLGLSDPFQSPSLQPERRTSWMLKTDDWHATHPKHAKTRLNAVE